MAWGASTARGDFSYANFNSAAGLSLVGSAAPSAGALRLTPAQTGRAGAAWYSTRQQIGDGFSTTFTFRINGLAGGGGDGLAFVVQNTGAAAIGNIGCGLGYDGIADGIAVELDTFQNASCNGVTVGDPDGNHVAVHTLGFAPNSVGASARRATTSAIPDLSNGVVHTCRVVYVPGILVVYVDDLGTPVLSVPIDLGAILALDGGTGAYVGFTAGTGAATENHDVLSWTFQESPPPAGNHRPATPTITEPATDGAVKSPDDVHMETSAFQDADPGDTHVCSDWEIWTVSPAEEVWITPCIGGVERVHTHLGDGTFLGSYAGRTTLKFDTDYVLLARHRDSSGDPVSEWSFRAPRYFHTGSAGTIFAMVIDDIDSPPPPAWTTDAGSTVVLPAGGPAPSLTLGSGAGDVLLSFVGLDGLRNSVTNPGALAGHVSVRAVLSGGSVGVTLPPSGVRFLHDCQWRTVYLPAVSLAPGQSAYFWISENGSTFVGTPDQTQPDFTTPARSSPLPWAVLDPNFQLDVFATGLQLPVNIAFIPNAGAGGDAPFLYVTELYGAIKVVTRAGAVSDYATNLLNYNPTGNFPGSGEQGVAGIAVDPGTGDVYAGMLYDSAPPNGDHWPKVVRFTSDDGGRTAASRTTILAMPGEPQGQSHFISNISIGPDGKLYVHMGDGFDTARAQDLTSFRGKVLRMNLDGTPCADNPYYNAADGISATDYVYVYGVRNPFGGAWRALDSSHYTIENGPSIDRFTKGVRGRNYLWDGTDASMNNFAIFTYNPAHGPVNAAFVQPSTFGGSGFPPAMFDHAFISESGPTWATGPQALGKRVVHVALDAAGNLAGGPATIIEYNGTGKATCVGLAAGPDGLYFTDLYKDSGYATPIDRGANILRLHYAPPTDCNGNGRPDWCDVAMETSRDDDKNGVPDECDCPADIDGNGFVNGEDFDAFAYAFFLGDPAADFDHNGFVNGEDFDGFAIAFFLGC